MSLFNNRNPKTRKTDMSTTWMTRTGMIGLALTLLTSNGSATEAGDITVDLRLRVETAEIDGTKDADNTTSRLRLGYFSPDFKGFKFGAEGEFTTPFSRDAYNAAGVHGNPDKAVIADPESYDIDQLFVAYTLNDTMLKVGRQVIVLDNHRFVGHVGWRQNRQTFDAASVTDTSVENLKLFYAFVNNVSRIFGSEAPSTGGNAGEADSSSHLMNATYAVNESLQVTAIAISSNSTMSRPRSPRTPTA
jgi:hypothetical protein